jgi:hypothetical protein
MHLFFIFPLSSTRSWLRCSNLQPKIFVLWLESGHAGFEDFMTMVVQTLTFWILKQNRLWRNILWASLTDNIPIKTPFPHPSLPSQDPSFLILGFVAEPLPQPLHFNPENGSSMILRNIKGQTHTWCHNPEDRNLHHWTISAVDHWVRCVSQFAVHNNWN